MFELAETIFRALIMKNSPLKLAIYKELDFLFERDVELMEAWLDRPNLRFNNRRPRELLDDNDLSRTELLEFLKECGGK